MKPLKKAVSQLCLSPKSAMNEKKNLIDKNNKKDTSSPSKVEKSNDASTSDWNNREKRNKNSHKINFTI